MGERNSRSEILKKHYCHLTFDSVPQFRTDGNAIFPVSLPEVIISTPADQHQQTMGSPANRAASRLRTVLFSSLANLAFPLTTFITGPLLARALGPDGRGLMAALLAPLSLANLMFTLGMPDALAFFVARGSLTAKKALQIAVAGGLACSALACIVLFFSAPYLFRNQMRYLPLFDLLLLTLPVTLTFSAVRGIVQGRRQFALINKERIAGALLRLIVLAVLVALNVLNPIDAVWVSVASVSVASAFLLVGLAKDKRAPASAQSTGSVVHYAGAVALGTFAGLIVIRLDQALMVSLTTPAELAYYAIAVSLAELPLTVVGASRDLAFSLAAEREDPQIVARYCRLTLTACGIICLAAGLATPIVLPLLFGRSFSPAIPMVEILLAGTLGRAVTTVIGAGLMTVGKTWLRSAIQLAGAAMTVTLLFAFVPQWGGIGAAWVTTLTFALLACGSMLVYVQSTGLRFAQCLVPTAADMQYLKGAVKAGWSRAARLSLL
jgi:O-antigen/teichoic acid export membrane protein